MRGSGADGVACSDDLLLAFSGLEAPQLRDPRARPVCGGRIFYFSRLAVRTGMVLGCRVATGWKIPLLAICSKEHSYQNAFRSILRPSFRLSCLSMLMLVVPMMDPSVLSIEKRPDSVWLDGSLYFPLDVKNRLSYYQSRCERPRGGGAAESVPPHAPLGRCCWWLDK